MDKVKSKIDLLQKSFFATEVTEKKSFKRFSSKASVYSVATYARGQIKRLGSTPNYEFSKKHLANEIQPKCILEAFCNPMKDIIDHLQKCGTDIFQVDEIDEPLMMTYRCLYLAVRDRADIFIVHPNYIEWSKDDKRIGEWKPKALIPVSGFSVKVEQIIKRDQVVSNILKLISTDNDKTTYKIRLTLE
jgi:hypothetical protein